MRGICNGESGVMIPYTPKSLGVLTFFVVCAITNSAPYLLDRSCMTRVRLTRKLATVLNGIDVSRLNVGDEMDLPDLAAAMLIAERWAEPASEVDRPFFSSNKESYQHRKN